MSCVKEYDILVIGELNVDLILRGEDVVPEFGQAEKLVDDASLSLGSSSAIFACGASRLGLRVGFLGKVGDDEFGQFMIKTLQSRGVDTSPVIINPNIKTGLTVHLSSSHDRAMLTFLGSITALTGDELDERLIQKTRHLHHSSFFIQRNIQAAIPSYFCKAREAGVSVSLDPGWDPHGQWNSNLSPALQQVDVFMPNEQEALAILGVPDLELALQTCSNRFKTVVIKRGSRGSVGCRGSQRSSQNIFPVAVADTVGAGDSFNAGFLYAYLNEMDLQSCLVWGSVCGALSVTGIGGIAAQPTVEEARRFIENRKP